MSGRGTSEGRYLIELDGIAAVRATEVSGLKIELDNFELYEGNKGNPSYGRGHFKVGEVTVKHAHALNQTGAEFLSWLQDFARGIAVERRGARFIVLDEDGSTPIEDYELLSCIPKMFQVESHTAGGNNPSFFTFSIQPEDMQAF